MMFVLLGLCACLGTAMAHAQQGPPMQLFGFERMRCSAWLADHRMEIEGETWVIAFWAGMNFENARSHQVGLGMNMKSIWDAVKLVCRDEPATTVLDATIRTYNRLQGQ
jgi:hypothetical protein